MRKRLRALLAREARAEDVLEYCRSLADSDALRGMGALRTYFYDAPPAEETLRNPVDGRRVDLRADPVWASSMELHEELERADDVALRLGDLQVSFGGWRLGSRALRELRRRPRGLEARDFVPDLSQKGVDLRVGLDIARIALRRQADVVVLVTGDSDFVPAMKFARREGIRVYLDTMGQEPRRPLLAHADRFLPFVPRG